MSDTKDITDQIVNKYGESMSYRCEKNFLWIRDLPEIIALVEKNHLESLQATNTSIIEKVIEIIKAEPDKIQTSSSYRMGYARCSRDKEALIRAAIKSEI